LAELFVGVPNLGSLEAGRFDLDLRAGDAALRTRSKQMVEVESLNAVVRADAVARSLGAEAGAFAGFIGVETAMLVSGGDEIVVLFFWDDVEEFGHERKR
jgi:hypothetical protein